ncbi:MAG: hypothetical protein HY936_02240 [Nitrosomonadales bacterium]|nr:hypothetical protein [Nitrosomonadales bacterium]
MDAFGFCRVAAMTRRCGASGAGMAASHGCPAKSFSDPLPQSAGFASNVSRDVAAMTRRCGASGAGMAASHGCPAKSFSDPLPQSAGRNPHLNPLPEGEEAIALSPSGGKLDRGLASNVSRDVGSAHHACPELGEAVGRSPTYLLVTALLVAYQGCH